MDSPAVSMPEVVRRALVEDLGGGPEPDPARDLTCRLSVPDGVRARARVLARKAGCIAGMEPFGAAFLALDGAAVIEALCADGDRVEPGQEVARVEAAAPALLAGERTALNFLQRLSGIATHTRAFVEAVAGTGARIYDTRKTTPGLRALERMAVAAGGGCNHRFGLFDQVLLKENHFGLAMPRPYEEVVRRASQAAAVPVMAEARDLDQAVAAVRGGAVVVLLDNFAPGPALREAVRAVRDAAAAEGRSVEVESSGGITLENVRAYAECGVDRISVGALTHSSKALDLSLLVEGIA